MRLQDGDNFIEIEAVDRVPEGLPTAGDTEFSVEVCSSGFRGQTFAWVEAKCMSSFLTELTELEKRRQGSATLSVYPLSRNCEFFLRIWSVDRRGHMAIGGRLTKLVYRGEADLMIMQWSSVSSLIRRCCQKFCQNSVP